MVETNSGSPGDRRLSSWKEIAAFFGRDERTVKRWETVRGLPVRRVPRGTRSSVFAYQRELEDWLHGATPAITDGVEAAAAESQAANRLTVYVTAASSHPGKRYETYTENGLEAYYWANDKITCTVVGDLPQAQMQVVAKGVYQQLCGKPDPAGRS